jgi:transcriptional regulator with XRE-family HTH domain
MEASKIVLAARKRMGLTQRELAERTGIPQPMISAIERGRQDPRHSTVERILAVTDQELDIVMRAGRGVDRTQFVESLRLTPLQRLRYGVAASKSIDRLVRSARRVR